MPLDGITAKFLSIELSNNLVGARIDRVFQTDSYDVFLKLRNESRNLHLLMSANPSNARIQLTDDNIENPLIPLRFCTVLRKYLTGGRILSIETPGYERIFMIKIQTVNEIGDKDTKMLIVEIMGRFSNIILVNESLKIIDCAIHVDEKTSRVREVLPTRKYEFPPSQNKHDPKYIISLIESNEFLNKIPTEKQESSVEQYLLESITGISPLFVNELCIVGEINPKTKLKELDAYQSKGLEETIKEFMVKIINNEYTPTLFYKEEDSFSPNDFHSFPLHTYPFKKTCESISFAMDEYYSRIAKQSNLSQKKSYLVKLVSQKYSIIQKKLIIHNKDLEECKSRENFKKFGDLILSYLYLIKSGDEEVIVTDYYDENSTQLIIPLQSNISGSQNAQKYYKKYNKLKSKFEMCTKLIEEELKELEYYKSIQVSLANVDSNEDIDAIKAELFAWDSKLSKNSQITPNKQPNKKTKSSSKKKELPIKPRKFISSDEFEIIIGRNNIQNDDITTKESKKDDIWLHIQKAPGTHVIIKTRQQLVPPKTIEEAAMLAAWYSKSSDASINTKVTIDYCPIKNVWKPKKSSPGHVLYKDFNSITVKTLLPDNISEKK